MLSAVAFTGAHVRIGDAGRDATGVMTGVAIGVASFAAIRYLHHPTLFHLVDNSYRQETRRHLRHNIRTSVICCNPSVVQCHQSYRRIEMASGDAASQESQERQGAADRPRVAGRHDDA